MAVAKKGHRANRKRADTPKDAADFIARRTSRIAHRSEAEIERVTTGALSLGNRDEILRDAQANREQLKRRPGQIVRGQPK